MDNGFLFVALFLPRISLLWYYIQGWIPMNPVPFWGDALMAVFIPRVLILLYIAFTIGFGGWFIAHLLFLILAWGSSGSTVTYERR